MPKLVIVTHCFPSWCCEPFGPHYLAWPAHAASRLGFDVEILTTNYTIPQIAAGYGLPGEAAEETRDGITIRRYPLLARNRFLSPGLMKAAAESRADVMAVHSYGYWYTEVGWLATRARHTPLVFTPYFHSSGRRLRLMYDRTVGRTMCNDAAAVHVFTRHTKNVLEQLGVRATQCHVLPLPLNPETIRVLRGRESTAQQHVPVILGVGGLIPRKGWEHAIRSLSLVQETVPAARLVILGYSAPATNDYLVRLRQIITDLKLSESVNIKVDPTPAELATAYATASVFTFPSAVESFGLVVLEAMTARLPVVANAASGLDELVPAGEAGYLIDVNDAVEYAAALSSVLTDGSLRRRLGTAGSDYVKKHFETTVLTPRLQELLEHAAVSGVSRH